MQEVRQKVIFDPKQVYDFELEKTMDEKVLIKEAWQMHWRQVQKRSIEVDVTNTDRAFGTILGAEITKRLYGYVCRRIPLPSNVTEPADRASVPSFQRV